MRSPSRAEWFVVAVIVVALIALVPPTPNWSETSSQSCHLCGNRQVVIRNFRWWQLHNQHVEPVVGAKYAVPDGHIHDWWQYSSTFNSYYGTKWASDNSARYRDGRFTWEP